MKQNIISLEKGWWKNERPPTDAPLRFQSPSRTYALGTKMLTTKEAAIELGVSIWTLYTYIRSKELSAIPKKKGYQIPAPAIQDYREWLKIKKRVKE